MSTESLKAWGAFLDAVAWPVASVLIAILAIYLARYLWKSGGILSIKLKDVVEFSTAPATGYRPPSQEPRNQDIDNVFSESRSPDVELEDVSGSLPDDYLFLNHTSFFKSEKQEELQKKTKVDYALFHIHVIVDSYYPNALSKVKQVVYMLHAEYPCPIQIRKNVKNKFLLKELAYGEYVLKANVYLKGRAEPVRLQRYITLWNSGPPIIKEKA